MDTSSGRFTLAKQFCALFYTTDLVEVGKVALAHRGRPRTYSSSPTRDRVSAMAILTTGRMMAAFTIPAKASVVIKS